MVLPIPHRVSGLADIISNSGIEAEAGYSGYRQRHRKGEGGVAVVRRH